MPSDMDMTGHSFTLVPTEWLKRIEGRIGELDAKIEGATITPAPEWLTISEAARKMEVDRTTIHRWADTGRIEVRGSGKTRRVKVKP